MTDCLVTGSLALFAKWSMIDFLLSTSILLLLRDRQAICGSAICCLVLGSRRVAFSGV